MPDNVTSLEDHKAETFDLAALVAKDKQERSERCLAKINAALEEERCAVSLFIIVGEQKMPINSIIGARIDMSIDAVS